MRINITINSVNEAYLENEADKFASREAMMPYLIMSKATLNKLTSIAKDSVMFCDDGTCEFKDYKILINESLRFGDVDIR